MAAMGMYQAALDKLERQRGPKQVSGRIVPFLGGQAQHMGYGRVGYGG